jgi:hypothetical protein
MTGKLSRRSSGVDPFIVMDGGTGKGIEFIGF